LLLFAISKGERNPDAFAIVVPVFERKNHMVGAITITITIAIAIAIAIAGPITRFTPEAEKKFLADLKQSAALLCHHFGMK